MRPGGASMTQGLGNDRETSIVMRCHDMQLLLCDELEALADRLPSGADRQHCLHLARAVYPLVVSTHEIEEALLFDPLGSLAGRVPDVPATLERLRFEHQSDLCFAEEIHDALLAFGRGEPVMTADAVGYLLRAFFEGVRRHVAFEKEILVPLLALVRPVSRSAS
ncbi:hemerythrin domain-containing protein [Mesorhizobium sp. LHD-90]|uniref:hemerythrin domain-containing protein n=1 Tax=Mesorhizobium sp. LHD-90 TaxID=3071414 RepID=UPI0027E0B2A5|nr:hemerythrin domain-containing protein [Mesorhizobium sp. LHD-90]MDQ6435256.1 hemerythrin domain-containing protein [Mesorhizobium sp. LHD-90]